MLRPEPRNASAGLVSVANHAGAAPKIIPVTSAKPKAKAKVKGKVVKKKAAKASKPAKKKKKGKR